MKGNFLFLISIILLICSCKDDEGAVCTNCNDEVIPNYKILSINLGTWDGSSILTMDDNIVTAGRVKVNETDRMYLVKSDISGEVINSKYFHQFNSRGVSVHEDNLGNFYVVGSTHNGVWFEDRKLAVAKLDKNFDVIWANTYQADEEIIGYGIIEINENELIFSGTRNGDLALLKLDSLGNEVLFKIIENENSYLSANILRLQNDDFLVTTNEESNLVLIRLDKDFNKKWERKFGGVVHKGGRSSIQLENSDIITVGSSTHLEGNTSIVDFQQALILRTNSQGELIWEKEIGNIEHSDFAQSIVENADGTFTITGYSIVGTEVDHMLMYVGSDGNEINTRYFHDSLTTRGQNIIKINEGQNIITGFHSKGTFLLNVDNWGNE